MNHILFKGITNYESLFDFDLKAIQNLLYVCKETIPSIPADANANFDGEAEVPIPNISSISAQRLIVSISAAKYYSAIGRVMTAQNMHYTHVLS